MVVFEILAEVVKINIVVMKIFYSLVRGVRLKVRGGFVLSSLRFDVLGTENIFVNIIDYIIWYGEGINNYMYFMIYYIDVYIVFIDDEDI